MNIRIHARTILLASLLSGPAWAANFYVRTSGNDLNAGTSPATALRTVQRALQLAQPGDVIYVGRGTYTGALTTVRAGTASGRIRLVGDHTGAFTGDRGTPTISVQGGSVTIAHDNIDFERFTLTGTATVVASGANNITFRSVTVRDGTILLNVTGGSTSLVSCTLRNGRDDAVVITNAGRVTINASTIRDLAGSGVVVNGSSALATVDRNTFLNLRGAAAEAGAGTLSLLNNLIRASATGVSATGGTSTIVNNTFFQVASGVVQTGGTMTLRNSILTQSTTALQTSGGTLTHSNNLYWLNGTDHSGVVAAASDVFADPRFVNASRDWRIQNSSPAIDTGFDARSLTTLDRNGATRPRGPAFDIGAYEITGAAANVPYAADFESGSAGPEWTSSTTNTSAGTTRFAGPYAAQTLGLRLNTTPGQDYVLIFDAWLFNTWDGDNTQWGPDYFAVAIDGSPEFRATYAANGFAFPWNWPDRPELSRTDVYGGGGADAVFRSVVVPFTAENSVTFINFTGENLQGWADEGWGVDNVRVVRAAEADAHTPKFVEAGRLNGFGQTVSSGEPSGLFAGDLNADGFLDIIQTGGATTRLSRNTGSGFSTAAFGTFIRQGALGDFTGDGMLDFFGFPSSSAATFMMNVGGTLVESRIGLSRPSNGEGLAAGDINRDGWLDAHIFAANGNWSAIPGVDAEALAESVAEVAGVQSVARAVQASQVELSSAVAPSGGLIWTVAQSPLPNSGIDAGNGEFASSVDVNNDGYPDFFYHYGSGRLLLSKGDGTYDSDSRGISIVTGNNDRAGSAWGDFNNDGNVDLFVARRNGNAPYLWVNPGPVGSFTNQAVARGINPNAGTVAGAWGDYDNDGDLDLIVTPTNGTVRLYQNQGPPGYTFIERDREGVSIEARGGDALFADVNNDGALDLALTTENSAFQSALFLNQMSSDRSLTVRLLGRGPGGINRAGVGTALFLHDAASGQFVARRDIGIAKGHGQEPIWAHFGGVDPSRTYEVRFMSRGREVRVPVTPAVASTTIGLTTIPRMATINEPLINQRPRVISWGERSREDAEQSRLEQLRRTLGR